MCTSQGVITCKAAVCWGLGMTVKLEEIQVDPRKSGEVRVKMLCASICHTDVLGIQGSPYVNGFPLVPGHEGVGVTGLMPDNTSRMSCRGKKLQPTWTCATWSEYTVVNANYLLKVDPGINLAHASFISCGFSTGYGAAGRKPKLKVDQVLLFSVLVL
ncbi:Alcohol dehydrogenase [Arachis hypogaea]|nr:Alcohol dehydrogenase [Arachis hypogaea]